MNYIKKLIILALLLNSCSGVEQEKATIIQQDDLESEMIETYKEGVQALKEGDVLYATKKFKYTKNFQRRFYDDFMRHVGPNTKSF